VNERAAESHARIVREIVKEKAVTLGRAGERLEAALAALAALVQAWRAAGDDAAARAGLADEYERAWRAADTARQTLLIQREAVGLRQHRDVDRQFPVPPRRLR
jgi:gamma-glutamylcysteine synthetase